MDDKLFKQKLSEVADWEIPKLSATDVKEARQRARGRGRPTNEDLYQEEHEQVFLELFQGINPTQAPQITKLKKASCECEDCGRVCENGRHTEKKLYETGGKKNWRERCLTCDMSRNPYTGKYDMDHITAGRAWIDFLRETKGLYKTKRNSQREDAGIITFYPDLKRSDK